MKLQKFPSFFIKISAIFVLLSWAQSSVVAQDEAPEIPVAKLTISDTNVEAIPTVGLRLYGRDEQGNPIDFSQRTLSIQSNGTPVGPVSIQGEDEVGTLTVFLIDIPTGVANQLTAVQEAIQAYASPGGMKEQVDYVAVFQVGESGPQQLLEPVQFHNSVSNLFATPLTPETGSTALIDSTVDMLSQIESLKSEAGMAASIVLLTDGTDSISVRNEAEDVAVLAAELGVPLHTLWLLNDDLGEFSHGAGQEYLAELAADSGGIAALLSNSSEYSLIWDRIAGFRSHTRVVYSAAALTPGDALISVSLADDPTIQTETAVSIPNNIPTIELILAAESRTLSVPNLERPLTLQFNTTLQWLDGVERTLEAAQLVVNGETVADVPVKDITKFAATTDKFQFGNNAVEVVILDDQGILARSPELILTVNEGSRSIPQDLSAGLSSSSNLTTILISVVILGFAAAVWIFALRNGWLKRFISLLPQGRRPASSREPQVVISDEGASYSVTTQPIAFLEVVTTKSTVDKEFPLRDLTIKIGRSPSQTDISFDQDITVSRVHAIMRLEGSHYRLYDEGSTSGTWINERQVPDYGTQLQDGDEIHLGEVILRFKQGGA